MNMVILCGFCYKNKYNFDILVFGCPKEFKKYTECTCIVEEIMLANIFNNVYSSGDIKDENS